jgi:hypothetical protein
MKLATRGGKRKGMARPKLFGRWRQFWSKDDCAYINRFTGGTCYYCRIPLPKFGWAIEHMIPIARDGLDRFDNLVPACAECNKLKGTRTVEEFKKYLAEVVYWRLDAALDAIDIQERYGLPAPKLRRLRQVIEKAQDAALDLDIEISSRPFPGEALVHEFNRAQSEWFDVLSERWGAEERGQV